MDPGRPLPRRFRGAPRPGFIAAIALAALLLLPAQARASEVVVEAPEPTPTVEAGTSADLVLRVSAVRDINCAATESDPALATLPAAYSLSAGGATPGDAGDALPFYRDLTIPPAPTGGCEPDWDTAPAPYSVTVPLSVAADTPPGQYPIVVRATISGKARSLIDSIPLIVEVTVSKTTPPPPPRLIAPVPAVLAPPPIENKTVNLVPLSGTVFIKVPEQAGRKQITNGVQVPDGTRVNAKRGTVQVVSDSRGRGDGSVQAATFWNDSFAVGYTRAATPGRGRRAKFPITELVVTSKCIRGPRLSPSGTRSNVFSSARRKRRRRGLFGRGKGRFRTRGSYGAGTVRGTRWYTENRCDGTLFEVFTGVVSVRDFGLRRSVSVRKGQGYIAGPHRKNEGSSAG